MVRRVSLLMALGSTLLFGEFALWVVRDILTSPASVDELVQKVKDLGIDRIYVQIIGRMDAFYDSKILPRSEMLENAPKDFYPFEYLLGKLKGSNVKVSAWMNVFYAWPFGKKPESEKHVINAHPDWVTYDESGRSMFEYGKAPDITVPGIFLDPGLEEVREFVAKVAEEIASKFDVDEIHLDYIRYPYRTFGYNPKVMKRYRKWVRKAMKEGKLKNMANAFDDFRREQVSLAVSMIHETVKRYGKKLSAAVYAYYDDAYNGRLQDWLSWIENGYLDYAVMMAYDPSVETVRSYIEFVKKRLGKLDRVRVGLGLYKMYDKPELLRSMIEMVSEYRPDEIVFFSYKYLKGDAVRILREFTRR